MGPLQQTADDLVKIVEVAAASLRKISGTTAAIRSRPGSWSIKEIIGHLIDSAANNHQRFVRADQSDQLVFPGYDQDSWVLRQEYQAGPWPELIEFWVLYNRHLAHVIRRLPETTLGVSCRIGPNDPVTLHYIVDDYIKHLLHHLRTIASLESTT